MNISEYPLSLRIYRRSYQLLGKIHSAINAIFAGVWLGILDRKVWQKADGTFYDNDAMYQDESYNRSGLWDWEEELLSKYFQSSQKILLAGAGGGREVYALNQKGYRVDGFECNPQFVEYANKFLQQEEIEDRVIFAPRDTCPNFGKIYDGAIIGWGAYTNIQGREKRIKFLQQVRSHLQPGSPILLSFFPRDRDSKHFKLIASIGNIIIKFRNLDPIEVGDSLFPHHIFVHYFNETEIKSELKQAGFEMLFYSEEDYGKAVGTFQEH